MEHKILPPHLSTTGDLRQRRQKVVLSDLNSEANDAGDRSDIGYAVDSCKTSLSVSATRSLWFYWARLCLGLVVMLVCAWAYASYVKRLHETHLWFSNIQVWCIYYCLAMQHHLLILVLLKSCFVHWLCCLLYATALPTSILHLDMGLFVFLHSF